MIPAEDTLIHSEDDGNRYDLAGNPLPPLPKAEMPQVSEVRLPAPSSLAPAFTPPPGSSFAYATPPGSAPGYPAPAPAKAPQGPLLYFSLAAGLLLLIGLIFGVQALKPKMVAAPAVYKTYTAIDNSFSCDQPGTWTLHETGATSGNLATATFEDGHARVRIVSDAIGSLLGDVMGSSNPNLPPSQQVAAVEKLHIMDKKQLAASLTDYKEEGMQKFQSASGDARVSEWTASGGVGTGGLHGYRVTMLGREREFTIICFCPTRNWAVLMPAFQRIISSVKPGTGS